MSEHDVNTIMVMGFTRTQAQKALMSNNNNLENALEFLLGNDVAGNDIDDNYQNNNQNNNYDRLVLFQSSFCYSVILCSY